MVSNPETYVVAGKTLVLGLKHLFSLSTASRAKLGQRHNVSFDMENKFCRLETFVPIRKTNLSPVERFVSFPKQTPDCIPTDYGVFFIISTCLDTNSHEPGLTSICLVFLLGSGHAVQESEATLFAAAFLFLFSNILASHHRYYWFRNWPRHAAIHRQDQTESD